ncbi:hypothetical protein HDU90_007608 [Geranomyces variabilis]|nr:hypothetical protein HDU90_007608 [Geranomyces variabilis]
MDNIGDAVPVLSVPPVTASGKIKFSITEPFAELLDNEARHTRSAFLTSTRKNFEDVFDGLNEARREIATADYLAKYVTRMHPERNVKETVTIALEAVEICVEAAIDIVNDVEDIVNQAHNAPASAAAGTAEDSATRAEDATAATAVVGLVEQHPTVTRAGLTAATPVPGPAREQSFVTTAEGVKAATTVPGLAAEAPAQKAGNIAKNVLNGAGKALQDAEKKLSAANMAKNAVRQAGTAVTSAVKYWNKTIKAAAIATDNNPTARKLGDARKAVYAVEAQLLSVMSAMSAAEKAKEYLAKTSANAASARKESLFVPENLNLTCLTNLHGTPYDRYVVDKIFEPGSLKESEMMRMRDVLLFAECLSHDGSTDNEGSCWFLRNCTSTLHSEMYKIQVRHNNYRTPFFYFEYRGKDGSFCDVSWTKDQGHRCCSHNHALLDTLADGAFERLKRSPDWIGGQQMLISPKNNVADGRPAFGHCLAYCYWPYSPDPKWVMDTESFCGSDRTSDDDGKPDSKRPPESLEIAHHPTLCEKNGHNFFANPPDFVAFAVADGTYGGESENEHENQGKNEDEDKDKDEDGRGQS